MRVSGNLILPADAPAAGAGQVHVEVREEGSADAPSRVVAAQVLSGITLAPGASVPFAIDVPVVEPRRHYGLRAWIDLDGDGRAGPGDLLSTVAQPVLTFGAPSHADVPVVLVAAAPRR
jgi:hypothetical protein